MPSIAKMLGIVVYNVGADKRLAYDNNIVTAVEAILNHL